MTRPTNVLWIGGRSGAGKSTVARLLARRHGLRWYSCDTKTWEHLDRAVAAGDPAAVEWARLTPLQRSELPTVDKLRLTLDRTSMVLADVAGLLDRPAVIAEGTNVLPSMVPDGSCAVWLTAEPTIRAERTRQRGWGGAGGEIDLIRARELQAEIDTARATVIDTTHHTGVLDTVTMIETTAASWFASRPTATSTAERRSLIREGNVAVVRQYRGGRARAGNTDTTGPVRSYDCECAADGCVALVQRALESFPDPFTSAAAPILAPEHRTAT